MSRSPKLLVCSTLLTLGLTLCTRALAQEQAKPKESSKKTAVEPQPPLPADPEARFTNLFTRASLTGRWAPLKDGVLGEQRGGDKYHITSVVKGIGDNWTVNAKMKYRDQEFTMPIPVQVKFAGDTAVLIVDKLSIPGGGTYSARLLIYERTYSGTWSGERGGGMLYGTITNDKE